LIRGCSRRKLPQRDLDVFAHNLNLRSGYDAHLHIYTELPYATDPIVRVVAVRDNRRLVLKTLT
jgi:hypothetical protein